MSGNKKPAAPAQVLREQKAKIEEVGKVELPRMPTGRHPASDAAEAMGKAKKVIGDIQVPMTLSEIANIIGRDCHASDFGSSALLALAGQLEGVMNIAEEDNSGCYDRWCVFDNIVERMKLAGRVVGWLESNDPGACLPSVEVEP